MPGFKPYEMDAADKAGGFEGHMGNAYIRTEDGCTKLWLNQTIVRSFTLPSEAMAFANKEAKIPTSIKIGRA